MTGCYQHGHKQQLSITFHNRAVHCFNYHNDVSSPWTWQPALAAYLWLSVFTCGGEKQKKKGEACGIGHKSATHYTHFPSNKSCLPHYLRKIRGDKYKSGTNATEGNSKPLTLSVGWERGFIIIKIILKLKDTVFYDKHSHWNWRRRKWREHRGGSEL